MARSMDDIIADATGHDPRQLNRQSQALSQQQQQQSKQSQAQANTVANTAGLSAIVSMEKTDMMFWLLVAQTLLLFLIYAQLRR